MARAYTLDSVMMVVAKGVRRARRAVVIGTVEGGRT
jgi:hypothetical protein